MVLWSTHEFGFIGLPEAVMTGSSLMPQKQNPDLLEVARAQAGVGLGALAALGALLKGLPLGYNRDLQEDKAQTMAAFRAADIATLALTIVVERLTVDEERMAAALRGGFLTATEVADYLVRRGVPFREAHHLAGQAVRVAEGAGRELWELPLEAYRRISPQFGADITDAVMPRGAVAAKDVAGGTAPSRVAEALAGARAETVVQLAWLDQAEAAQRTAEEALLRAAPG
jgi:argininosuccinate lyase